MHKRSKRFLKAIKVLRMVALLIILTGVGFLVYPKIADSFNKRYASHIAASYDNVTATMSEEEIQGIFNEAYSFNEDLRNTKKRWELPGNLKARYESTLDITGTGVIGTVYVPKIGISVPIYHGSTDSVLQIAAGHMEGSSFPTGEKGSHAVISAHTGMASAKLFTELGEIEVGDCFAIHILNRTLLFNVESTETVLPEECESLEIDEASGQVTLVTCTPFGVNSHRLLVHGKYAGDINPEDIDMKSAGFFTNKDLIYTGICVLLLLLVVLYIRRNRKRNQR